jgi:hypothetical protein
MTLPQFNQIVNDLIKEKLVFERDNFLFVEDMIESGLQKMSWSRSIFARYRKYLALITKIPWIKYIGMTGANAFETCNEIDDIDLLIITSRRRLWLTRLLIMRVGKLLGKRHIVDANYFIDEDNLKFYQEGYFVAVQVMSMVSVMNPNFKKKLLEANPWIYKYLPNATIEDDNPFYLIKETCKDKKPLMPKLLDKLNTKIYEKYKVYLREKFPDEVGGNLLLSEGVAKLHTYNHQKLY